MNMRKVFLFALLFISSAAHASEVSLSLFEKLTSSTTAYSLETRTLAIRKTESVQGSELPQLNTYRSSERKLIGNGTELANADEVLFQCQVDGVDVVVVREEYNSLAGPLKLLAAFGGHPVQVSKILVLTIANGRVVSEGEITRKEASYHWNVKIFK